MGAPKQKWTAEEESALKAGVVKHGAGKWRTIVKDPEYSSVLYLRSNVDLKDKWRNMGVMSNGLGALDKTRLALRRTQQVHKDDENIMALSTVVQSNEEIVDAKPLAISGGPMLINCPKRTNLRLDSLILEAITSLEELGGSNRTTIAAYIEEQYYAPPNFKRLLSAKLKSLTTRGRLIKVKRKYRIAPPMLSDKRRNSSMLLLEGRQRGPPRVDKEDFKMLTKSEIVSELSNMRSLSGQEAAAVAARAVSEAEAAIAEAEVATREAEVAEADAEAAQAFAEAAMKALKGRSTPKMMIRA